MAISTTLPVGASLPHATRSAIPSVAPQPQRAPADSYEPGTGGEGLAKRIARTALAGALFGVVGAIPIVGFFSNLLLNCEGMETVTEEASGFGCYAHLFGLIHPIGFVASGICGGIAAAAEAWAA